MNRIIWRHFGTLKRIMIEQSKDEFKRLDKWLLANYTMSWKQVQKAIRNAEAYVVTHDGKIVSQLCQYKLCVGDAVMLLEDFTEKITEKRQTPSFWHDKFKRMILFENDKIIAINKIAGLSSQGGIKVKVGVDTLAKVYLGESKDTEAKLVHRLDRDTTGVMVIAKTKAAAQIIAKCMKAKSEMNKQYLTLVAGKGLGIMLERIVVSDETGANFKLLESGHSFGEGEMKSMFKQIAEFTADQVLKTSSNSNNNEVMSLYKVTLKTGKKHQIRKHCALCLKTPVVGDVYYAKDLYHKSRLPLFLHAHSIEFMGNLKDQLGVSSLIAPVPDYFPEFPLSSL